MAEEFELKSITPDSVDAAISRAEHYRLLGQPVQARSICHDVLSVEPENQRALVLLVLATTDEFKTGASSTRDAKEHLSKLTDEYQRRYYSGLIAERRARAMLTKGPSASFAALLYTSDAADQEDTVTLRARPDLAKPQHNLVKRVRVRHVT